MKNNQLERIIDNLETVFRGDAWHGPSVMEMLNSIPIELVSKQKSFSKHTIAQNVFHLIAWRGFVLQKLKNNIHFDLISEEENYGNEYQNSQQNWHNLVLELRQQQESLIEVLQKQDDTLLDRIVPGQDYDFYKLLTGLIQHDTYHLGMIWVLWD